MDQMQSTLANLSLTNTTPTFAPSPPGPGIGPSTTNSKDINPKTGKPWKQNCW